MKIACQLLVLGWGLALAPDLASLRAADFTVSNDGFSSYTINGQANPMLTLRRGTTYTFTGGSSSHPFYLKSVQGIGTNNAFNSGVTGNGLAGGTLTFAVPANAPGILFYNCSVHAAMTGTINIVDPPPPPVLLSLAVSNKLALTFSGSGALAYFPEFNTNLASTNWFALTVETNFAANGTNEVICGRPPGINVFIRVRGQ